MARLVKCQIAVSDCKDCHYVEKLYDKFNLPYYYCTVFKRVFLILMIVLGY